MCVQANVVRGGIVCIQSCRDQLYYEGMDLLLAEGRVGMELRNVVLASAVGLWGWR